MNRYKYDFYKKNKLTGKIDLFEENMVKDKSHEDVFDTAMIQHFVKDQLASKEHYYEIYVDEIDEESGAPINPKGRMVINGFEHKIVR